METTPSNIQVLDLPSSTLAERTAHTNLLLELEAKKVAATLDVPTLSHQVRDNLRSIGEPVRLFGENNANVRDRLRLCLARIEIRKKGTVSEVGAAELEQEETEVKLSREDDDAVETKYTYATEELIKARELITAYSLSNAQKRLEKERKRRFGANRRAMKRFTLVNYENDSYEENHAFKEEEAVKELEDMDANFLQLQKTVRNVALEGSQYGDPRPLSAISTLRKSDLLSNDTVRSVVVTGGWSGSIKLWDGSSSALDLLSTKNMAHEDRIVGIDIHNDVLQDSSDYIVASASIDLMGKLWKVVRKEEDSSMKDNDTGEEKCQNNQFVFEEAAVLKGHQARLCNVAFHPSGRYVGTTSFDHTWRLWDIESGGKELMLQDGHWKEVYGIAFHGDGSLCSTTDFGSVVQLWDLRTGKSVCHFLVSKQLFHRYIHSPLKTCANSISLFHLRIVQIIQGTCKTSTLH